MMKKTSRTILALFGLLLILVTSHVNAENNAAKPLSSAIITKIKASLQHIMPGRQPDSIQAAVIPNLYEVSYGADIFYLTADAQYLIQGDIYALDSLTNLTEDKRASGRLGVIDAIDPATMIIFKPTKTRHVLTVFTDIDCSYCRKLHNEIDDYLAEGIEIRYLAYPRSGINSRSYYKAVTAWCADDRQQALTTAKSGARVKNKTCDHPVDQHMAAANQLGITGTPTLVFSDGTLLPGYVPAARLAQRLNRP